MFSKNIDIHDGYIENTVWIKITLPCFFAKVSSVRLKLTVLFSFDGSSTSWSLGRITSKSAQRDLRNFRLSSISNIHYIFVLVMLAAKSPSKWFVTWSDLRIDSRLRHCLNQSTLGNVLPFQFEKKLHNRHSVIGSAVICLYVKVRWRILLVIM